MLNRSLTELEWQRSSELREIADVRALDRFTTRADGRQA
jgi:hypothetical protein